jgi:hypothetical protein
MKKTNKSISGTGFHDSTVIATVDQLIQVLGEPTDDSNTGQDKVNFEWEMELESGDVFTVYDYKEYRMIARDEMIEWHIGGFDVYATNQAAREINEALLASRDNSALELVEKQIKQLAIEIVGDGKDPNKFFVTVSPYFTVDNDEHGDPYNMELESELLDGYTDKDIKTRLFDTFEQANEYYNSVDLDPYNGVGTVMIEDRKTGTIKQKELTKVVKVEYSYREINDSKIFGYTK